MAAAGSAAVALVAPQATSGRLAVLVLAGSVVLSFVLQLAVADRVGFVARLTASACGAFVLAAAGGLIGLLR